MFREIRTERLLLRRFRESDAPNYYAQLGSSREVTRHMLWQPHTSPEESRGSIHKILARYDSGDCYCWAITLPEEDLLIGRIDLLRIDREKGSCSFAYMLGENQWNKGYGTEALRAVIGFAFEALGMDCVTADHMTENPASGKVMEKAGMVHTRTLPEKYEKNGRFFDAEEYTVTRDRWLRPTEKC